MKKIFIVLLVVLSLAGCSSEQVDPIVVEKEELDYDFENIFSTRDYNEEEMYDVYNIDLSSLASNDVVTISSKATYIFTGESTNVKIEVDTDAKNQIILNNVTMSSDNDALIHIIKSDKTFITLIGTNELSTTMQEEVDGVDAAIFAKDNITINGNGSLDIYSSLDGIAAKDDLTITNGIINIETVAHAINVNEELAITNASISIVTNGGQEEAPYQTSEDSNTSNIRPGFKTSVLSSDEVWGCKGIKCDELIYIKDGTINIDSYDDAIHSELYVIIDDADIYIKSGDDAIHSSVYLEINGGTIDIDYCYEGLEAQRVVVNDGVINIDSYDDGINATGSNEGDIYIYIHGGEICITIIEISKSPEADGLDSNGDILITGGTTLIHGTTNTKDTPLDFDGVGQITGGTFLTSGSYSATCQNFSIAEQGAIYYQLSTSTYYTDEVILKDSNGNIVVKYTPINKYQVVHISSSDIIDGENYTLCIGSKTYTIKMSSNIYGTPTHR